MRSSLAQMEATITSCAQIKSYVASEYELSETNATRALVSMRLSGVNITEAEIEGALSSQLPFRPPISCSSTPELHAFLPIFKLHTSPAC